MARKKILLQNSADRFPKKRKLQKRLEPLELSQISKISVKYEVETIIN